MELKEITNTLQKAVGATAFAALITNNTLENFPDGFKIWFIKNRIAVIIFYPPTMWFGVIDDTYSNWLTKLCPRSSLYNFMCLVSLVSPHIAFIRHILWYRFVQKTPTLAVTHLKIDHAY